MQDCCSTVYLYYSSDDSDDIDATGYFLFGMDIIKDQQQGWDVKSPVLLARIPFPRREEMVCAKLGSKFYFLGGDILIGYSDFSPVSEYPSDVFVYDTTDPNNSQKDPVHRITQAKPMNSGKSKPLTFEANGKLYVLGQSLLFSSNHDDEIWFFEEYDPVKDCWTKLGHPSFHDIATYGGGFLWFSSFVVSSEKVLIVGSFEYLIFSFNPLTYEWSEVIDVGSEIMSKYLFVEDSLYKVWTRGMMAKLGPLSLIKDDGLFDVPYFSEAVIDWGHFPPSSFEVNPFFMGGAVFCHLGDRCFCTIRAVTGLTPNSGSSEPDFQCCRLDVIIYKDFQENPSTCFKLKCLHQASHTIKENFSSGDILASCQIMIAEEG